jgi:hypothetical protein
MKKQPKLVVADEKGNKHAIVGSEFGIMAITDIIAKLNDYEAFVMKLVSEEAISDPELFRRAEILMRGRA